MKAKKEKLERLASRQRTGCQNAKKALKNEFEKGRWSNPVRARIEREALFDDGVDRGKGQGRDVQGPGCRSLAGSQNKTIFEAVNKIMSEEGTNQETPDENVHQAMRMSNLFQRAMILWDSFIAQATADPAKDDLSKDQRLEKFADTVKKVVAAWEKLGVTITPKVHCILKHGGWAMVFHEGHWCKLREDWVKRMHQQGRRNDDRSRGLRDCEKATRAQSKWEEASKNATVLIEKTKVKLETERAFKGERKQMVSKQKRVQRMEQRSETEAEPMDLGRLAAGQEFLLARKQAATAD